MLVQRHKRLIYSIPYRAGFSAEDCADIFQSVCLELFSELDSIRSPGALRSWLITVTGRKCREFRARSPIAPSGAEDEDMERLEASGQSVAEAMEEAARDQQIRDAIGKLPPRCQEMVRLLFYSQPPLPYETVARRLGLATGSVGFIRGRCLKRLRKLLEEEAP
jgi:RNA polymerase sigma factor (sigma-70 family)